MREVPPAKCNAPSRQKSHGSAYSCTLLCLISRFTGRLGDVTVEDTTYLSSTLVYIVFREITWYQVARQEPGKVFAWRCYLLWIRSFVGVTVSKTENLWFYDGVRDMGKLKYRGTLYQNTPDLRQQEGKTVAAALYVRSVFCKLG